MARCAVLLATTGIVGQPGGSRCRRLGWPNGLWSMAMVGLLCSFWCSSSGIVALLLLLVLPTANVAAFVQIKNTPLSPLQSQGFGVKVSTTQTLASATMATVSPIQQLQTTQKTRTAKFSTALYAIGALVKRAKLAEIEQTYVQQESTLDDSIRTMYARIQEQATAAPIMDDLSWQSSPGPLQQALTRRAGTLTVIAEYKRKLSTVVSTGSTSTTTTGSTGNTATSTTTSTTTTSTSSNRDSKQHYADWLVPELLSPVFREYGAAGIAVLADGRMGGCTYNDLAAFCTEQKRARNQVPGSVLVINSDVVLDAWQIAHSAVVGAAAVVLPCELLWPAPLSVTENTEPPPTSLVDDDSRTTSPLSHLLRAAAAANLEAIVSVSIPAQAQAAVDMGARMLLVNVDGIDAKVACIANLVEPPHQPVCKIAYIYAKNDKSLTEIEEAWAVRDQGFQCAWVCEALYKNAAAGSGNAATSEHPGAIIKAMRNKSSLKFASPKAQSGRGEGAREYLGDILM
jgi:indole-3-glycerol phosphate synthase